LLSATGVLLTAANLFVAQLPVSTGDRAEQAVTGSPEILPTGQKASVGSPSDTTSSPVASIALPRASASKRNLVASTTGSTFDWAAVESSDYKVYAANLRALGFPEDLVRAIVIFDINALYAPREAPLRSKPVAPDAPPKERQTMPTAADADRLRQLRNIEIEKQAALKDILGIDVPRAIMRTPVSRNFEGYEFALATLPLEKRNKTQAIVEDEWLAADEIKGLDRPAFVEGYRRIREERDANLKQILTPEEFERFEMHSTPAGTHLARRTVGMEPTEAEFAAMFRIEWQNWVDTGGVFGLYRAAPVPTGQIAAADQRMVAALQSTLGPDRYLDYQMSASDTGQRLRNFAARYDLPRETLVQVFQLQMETDQLAKEMARARVGNLPPARVPAVPSRLQSRYTALQQQTEQALGVMLWQAWKDGRNVRVKLDP
jgi:hypothetical protein